MKNITRLYNVINRSLFCTDGNLDYNRITEAFTLLANEITRTDYDECDNNYWTIGEYDLCPLDELIIGAYWHYTEFHEGQWSLSYAALCALGKVFSPGRTGPESENEAYLALNELAEATVAA